MIGHDNKGISIVEVLVVMGLVALISSLSASFIVSQRQQDKLRQFHIIRESYGKSIKSILSLNSACKKVLPNSGYYSTTSGTVNLTSVKGLDFFLENFYDDVFYISSARLTYNTLEDALSSYKDWSYQYTTNREIIGKMILEIKIKPDILKDMKGYDSIKSDQVIIPIKMFAENHGSVGNVWKGVSCSTEDSEEITYKAQICNLYGGFLTDGAHCDFTKIARTHTNSILAMKPGDIPVGKLTQTSTNQVERVRLIDIMCYIDSLMLLTADLESADKAGKKETVYCPYPGGNTQGRISLDARKFFGF